MLRCITFNTRVIFMLHMSDAKIFNISFSTLSHIAYKCIFHSEALLHKNLFCAITAYCTKLFCAITAYCTKPVLSNKPTSRGGLIAQNPLLENITKWRKRVPEMQ